MGISFNADEVFRIGMDVEQNGQAFYEAAAEACPGDASRSMLTFLRDQEAEHYRVFSEMRDRLPPEAKSEAVYDPDGEMAAYLHAVAESRVFTNPEQAQAIARECKKAADVLKIALQFEKDSVLMFQALKEMTREDWGKDKIDGLIRAEKGHIRQIHRALAQMESA